MLRKKIIPNCILLLLIFTFNLYSQADEIKFDRISTEDGLSQSVVTCIFKDKDGFMWFGTQDGLNKYDGFKFTVYKSVPFDSTSLSDNWVQAITEDNNGHLWIGTYSGGIFDFNKNNGTFTNYKNVSGRKNTLANNRVWTLLKDNSGSIWIGTSGGLDKYDVRTKTFTHYRESEQNNEPQKRLAVNSIYEDESGIIWIGTWGSGLKSFDKKKNIFTSYKYSAGDKLGSGFNYIKSIYGNGGFLWLGTSFGLLKFDLRNKSFEHIALNPGDKGSLQNSVLSITGDPDGNLLIGTHNQGLFKIEKKSGIISHYINSASNPHSLSDNWISDIYCDGSGIIWLGTGQGINRILPYSKYFLHYMSDPKNSNSLSANEVNSIFEDDRGTIWLGTWGGGLNSFDMRDKIFRHYRYSGYNKTNNTNDIVWAIFEDRDHTMWVGTYSGLKVFDMHTGKFKDPPFNTSTISNNNISDIFQDSFGYLWVGTWGGGLYRYDKAKKNLVGYTSNPSNQFSLSNNLITAIYQDDKKNLWIGTNAGGLNLYNYKEDRFYHFHYNQRDLSSLSNNNVTSIYEDKQGRLWIGTWGGGLNMLDLGTKKFTHFTEEQGLSNNIIYGILADNNNYLWLSTSYGLSRFNLSTFQFIFYDAKDGLGNNQFSQGYLKCRNGDMIFGGINGITVFNPDNIKINENEPKVVITSFSVFDKERKIESGKNNVNKIILNYSDHDFSIEFSTLDYMRPDKDHFAYMLEGYDKEWNYSKNRKKAYYTNIQPGEYIFKIKASNSDDIWTKNAAVLKIRIVPPFWKTIPFIAAIILSIMTVIYLIHRYRLEQLLKFERIRNTIAIDLHDDIGASLTRISLFSHAALRALKKMQINIIENVPIKNIESLLTEIDDNSRELISSMSDIVWAVNPKNDSFDKITIRMKDYTIKVFEANEIDYKIFIDPALSSLVLPMDFRRNIFMIYKEGIANILRHSNASKVDIKLVKEKDNIIISIWDNGSGFTVNSNTAGNGLKNINQRAASFKGSSNIISEPGKGTTLNVFLKLP